MTGGVYPCREYYNVLMTGGVCPCSEYYIVLMTGGVCPCREYYIVLMTEGVCPCREYYKAQDKLIEEYELLEEKLFGEVEEEEKVQEESHMNRISLRLSKISFAANLVSCLCCIGIGVSFSLGF